MLTIKELGKISNKKSGHCHMTMQEILMLLIIIFSGLKEEKRIKRKVISRSFISLHKGWTDPKCVTTLFGPSYVKQNKKQKEKSCYFQAWALVLARIIQIVFFNFLFTMA